MAIVGVIRDAQSSIVSLLSVRNAKRQGITEFKDNKDAECQAFLNPANDADAVVDAIAAGEFHSRLIGALAARFGITPAQFLNEIKDPSAAAGGLRLFTINRQVIDPISLADGEGQSLAIGIPGVLVGDFVNFAPLLDLVGVTVTASVTAQDIVTIRIQNEVGVRRDIPAANWDFAIFRRV